MVTDNNDNNGNNDGKNGAGNGGSEIQAGARRWNRWRWVLYVSLALNLLLIGIPVGFIVSAGSEYRAFIGSLPHEVRQDIRQSLLAARPTFRGIMRDADRERMALAAAVAVTPYDPVGVGRSFDNLVDTYEGLIPPARSAMLSALGKLDDGDRARLAEALANMDFHQRRRWERHRWYDDEYDDDNNGDEYGN